MSVPIAPTDFCGARVMEGVAVLCDQVFSCLCSEIFTILCCMSRAHGSFAKVENRENRIKAGIRDKGNQNWGPQIQYKEKIKLKYTQVVKQCRNYTQERTYARSTACAHTAYGKYAGYSGWFRGHLIGRSSVTPNLNGPAGTRADGTSKQSVHCDPMATPCYAHMS